MGVCLPRQRGGEGGDAQRSGRPARPGGHFQGGAVGRARVGGRRGPTARAGTVPLPARRHGSGSAGHPRREEGGVRRSEVCGGYLLGEALASEGWGPPRRGRGRGPDGTRAAAAEQRPSASALCSAGGRARGLPGAVAAEREDVGRVGGVRASPASWLLFALEELLLLRFLPAFAEVKCCVVSGARYPTFCPFEVVALNTFF